MNISITDWGDLDQVLPIAKQYQVGLEVLEFADPENLDGALFLAPAMRQKLNALPSIGMHGPYSDLIPASRDPLMANLTRHRFQQAFEVAQVIGASHLVLHSGYIPKTYPQEQWIQNSLAFWVDFLKDKNTPNMIHVENVYEDDFTALRELIDLVGQAFGDDRMTVCLDIGHVNANSSRTLDEWIIGLGDRIRYVHLHNNDGILDDHWRLDRGRIDVSRVLDLLVTHSPKAQWTVETYIEDLEPSLHWLKERGYR